MKYDLVCFDLDGTLVDTFPFIIKSYTQAVIEKYGKIEETEKDIMAQIGLPIRQFYANYPLEDRTALQDAFAKHNDELQSKGVPFFCGIQNMLAELKKITKIGIVTSKRNQPLFDWINLVGYNNFFDVVVGRNDTDLHKPNGRPLELAMERVGVTPDRTLYVGDAKFDILCARNAKATSCLVGWTALSQAEIQEVNPDYIVKSANQIIDLVKGE